MSHLPASKGEPHHPNKQHTTHTARGPRPEKWAKMSHQPASKDKQHHCNTTPNPPTKQASNQQEGPLEGGPLEVLRRHQEDPTWAPRGPQGCHASQAGPWPGPGPGPGMAPRGHASQAGPWPGPWPGPGPGPGPGLGVGVCWGVAPWKKKDPRKKRQVLKKGDILRGVPKKMN